MDAVEFLKERERMCKSCEGKCSDCPIGKEKVNHNQYCREYIEKFPIEAVDLVEKWSDGHPRETFLERFQKQHPDAPMSTNGLPFPCPYQLGYEPKWKAPCVKNKSYDCLSCWKRPSEEAPV